MSNENPSNRDHWKELVKSLDLDIDLDEEPLHEGDATEVSASSGEEKTPDEAFPPAEPVVPESSEIPVESTPTSKVDPLFDLGWNSPDEDIMKESSQPDLPEEKSATQSPKSDSSKKSKDYVFGFGLFPDEPKEEPVLSEEETMTPRQEPTLSEEEPVTPEEEPAMELSFGEEEIQAESKDVDDTGDWMALAAQLGIPIRSETETPQDEISAEEPSGESEPFREADEAYDPLAAWESPTSAARKPREKKPKKESSWEKTSEEPREAPEPDASDKEEPIMIGKPKEESDKSKKDRRRGRRRGRRRDRDQNAEVESVETIEEEETATPPSDLEQEPWGLEEESSEEPKSKKRRRRPRRSRKSTTAESEEVEAFDESFDVEILDEEEEEEEVDKSKKIPKSHRGIPSWEEAIGLVVDKNLGSRNGQSGESRPPRSRGGRGKSGRRGGRSRG